MIITVLAIIIILIIFNSIMFFFLKKLIDEVNNEVKKSFIFKLQEYDDLINEKQKKLEEIEKLECKKEQEYIDNEAKNKEKIVCIVPKNIDYEVDGLLDKIKEIDNKFKKSNKDIILDFMKNNLQEDDIVTYNELISVRNYINNEGIYHLMINDNFNNVLENFNKNCMQLFDDFLNDKNIDINQFVLFLNQEIDARDPYIYVEVGNRDEDYSDLSPLIKVKYNSQIYRGIKIYYHNQLYNYSLE